MRTLQNRMRALEAGKSPDWFIIINIPAGWNDTHKAEAVDALLKPLNCGDAKPLLLESRHLTQARLICAGDGSEIMKDVRKGGRRIGVDAFEVAP